MLGRLLNLLIADANTVFVTISVLFSGLAVVAIYYLGKEVYDSRIGFVGAAIAITSPNFWFHGEVALSYILEAFFSTVVAFFCWKIYKGEHKYLWLSVIALGVAGGIRQNTLFFLLPLWLFSVRGLPIRKVVLSLGLLGFVCLLWFVPMVWMTGGWSVYRDAFHELWMFNTGHNSVFERGWPALTRYASALFDFTVYGVGAGIFGLGLAAYSIMRQRVFGSLDREKILFFSFWILPSVLFYLLIFIHPSNPGYVLVFLPALFILAAASVGYIGRELRKTVKADPTTVIASTLIITNLLFFLFVKSIVSYGEIRGHYKDISAVLNSFRAFNPSDTIIISEPYVFFGFRHFMYYLPEYRVYQIDIRVAADGMVRKTWWGMGRQTHLTDGIDMPAGVSGFAMPLIADDISKIKGLKGISIMDLPGANMHIAYGSVSLIRDIYPKLRIN